MKRITMIKNGMKLFSLIAIVLFCSTCEDPSPFSDAELQINSIEITPDPFLTNIALDIPYGGTFIEDMPDNFNFNNPNSWTGGLAQYVNHNYSYYVSYIVQNLGGCRAFDVEMDLYLTYDNGDIEVKTIYLGDIKRKRRSSDSMHVLSTNRQLIECSGEVFWYN